MEDYTGKRLDGRYEIHEIIGIGGMAVVYKAYDNIDDRTVAVKILKEEYLASEEFRRRFKNESKAIAVLSHPNIVKVYDVSYGDKLQYIVMEYVEGITLKEYIEQQGKLEVREAVHFTMQILRALQHAHDKGVVHRDIKPQNILLLSNGNIKVTDFGIARFSNDQRTMTGSAIGSVHYISPEQARGDIIDDKTDIYAVGVVLYEMLTGKVPFESDMSVSVALMQLSKDPTPPRQIDPSIPAGLEYIVLRAMQKNTNDRYQSAAEMLLDIEEFKRNPSVKFRDNFFVDKNPTKMVAPAKLPAVNAVDVPPPPPVQKYEPEPEEPVNNLIPVLKGVAIGLVALALIVLAAFYFFTDKLNGNKLTVPKFVDLNYAIDIAGNPKYKQFKFDIEYDTSSNLFDGTVIRQDPRVGKKIDKSNNTIKLIVATSVELVTVPNVEGSSYVEAKKILENRGFTVTAEPMASVDYDFGTVIKTEPEANASVEEGSSIIIYYASNSKLNEVPELVGWDYETAKSLLESVGLVLDENASRYIDSTEKMGTILDQDVAPGERVEAGTKIVVTMSNGNPPTTKPQTTTANVTFNLPSSYVMGNVTATLNGSDTGYSETLYLDGRSCTIPVSGSGDSNLFVAYVGGNKRFSCIIDFTTDPPTISGRENHYSSRNTIPSVTGMSVESAENTLEALGFYNFSVNYTETTDPSRDGIVFAQNPESTYLISYDTGTKITLSAYRYPGGTDEPSE